MAVFEGNIGELCARQRDATHAAEFHSARLAMAAITVNAQ